MPIAKKRARSGASIVAATARSYTQDMQCPAAERLEEIEVILSGRAGIRLDAGALLVPRGRKAEAIIVCLAFAPALGVSRERLIDLLWPDRGPEQANASLRQCLSELRALAPGRAWLRSAGGYVQWNAPTVRVAVLDAIARLRDADDEAGALAALEAVSPDQVAQVNAGPAFEDWARDIRARIERDLAQALLACVDRFFGASEFRAIRRIADAFLQTYPDHEEMTIAAMRAEIALGEEAAALRRFGQLKQTLADHLGCAPGSAVTALRDSLLAGTRREASATPPDTARHVSSDAPAPRGAQIGGPPLIFVPRFLHGDDPRAAALATALREEILSGLSRFRDIRLSSRDTPSSSDDVDAAQRSRSYELIVTHLDYDVFPRLAVRVVRSSDQEIVCADTLNLQHIGTASGVANVVRRVIAEVLPAVSDHFFHRLVDRANGPYDAYLIARFRSIHGLNPDEIAAARGELEAMVESSPEFIPAYPPLIRLLNTDHGYSALGISGPAERRRAYDLARRACAADPQDAHNHTVLGFCHLWHGQATLARGRFERAGALNPYHAERLDEVATGYTYLGDLTAARDMLDRSRELWVGDNDGHREDCARLAIAAGVYDEAIGQLDGINEPTIWSRLYAAMAGIRLGRDIDREIADWCRDVLALWHPREQPDAARMLDWIGAHHPFVPGLSKSFMASAAMAFGRLEA